MTGPHPYRREHDQPRAQSRSQAVKNSRSSTSHNPPVNSCKICSFTQVPPDKKALIDHQHFSSIWWRGLIGVEQSNERYQCPSCKSRHLPYPEPRTKIVISDSTLHNFFAPPGHTSTQYEGDIQHVDYVTVSGATLETLLHAFKLDYSSHTRPMDIVVVAGYNDLVRQHSREFIVSIFEKFITFVHGKSVNPDTPNTIAIAPLMYPPQFAWFDDDGPQPAGYTNRKEKLDWINGKIDRLNIANGTPNVPGFHKYGTRRLTRKHTDLYGQVHHRDILKHRWEHWRESDRKRMLHLTNDRRFKMGKALNEYFVIRT